MDDHTEEEKRLIEIAELTGENLKLNNALAKMGHQLSETTVMRLQLMTITEILFPDDDGKAVLELAFQKKINEGLQDALKQARELLLTNEQQKGLAVVKDLPRNGKRRR